jgi:hypothetical protein
MHSCTTCTTRITTRPLVAHDHALAAFLWHPRVSRLSVTTDPINEVKKICWQDYDKLKPATLLHCMSKRTHNIDDVTYADRTYDLVNEWTLVHDCTLVASMIGVYDAWSNSVVLLDLVTQCNTTENICIVFCYDADENSVKDKRLFCIKDYARYVLRVLAMQYGMSAKAGVLVVGPDVANIDPVDYIYTS